MAGKFVHLHVHTEYSLLDGLSKIKGLLARTRELGMDTLAITDHGALYGVIEFYKKATEAKIKPIIGIEAYITNTPLEQKKERAKTKNYHLLLFAKNKKGYQNLINLTSVAHLKGYYYRPRFDRPTLKKYAEDVICTSACAQGEIGQALINGDYTQAKKTAAWYQEVFAEDYFLEIQRHDFRKYLEETKDTEIKRDLQQLAEEEEKIISGCLKISRELGIPLVATNDSHYTYKEDAPAQDALVCIETGKTIKDKNRLRFIDAPSFYLTSPQEMAELFSDLPEAVKNTQKIADRCELKLTLGKWFFPKVKLPQGVSPESYLQKKALAGLKSLFPKLTQELKKRLDYELEVIIQKGYAPYFLIFQDMANWARQRNIPINTRGSVAGSLVSYSLGITTVDPIKYGLPFERFLNPFRPSAPDIDLDIADDRREEMILYLTQKYGSDKVAQICTFGRMMARAAVRDIARVMGYDYATGDRVAKLIPFGSQGFPMTIERALNESLELRNLYNTDEDAKKIMDLAQQIEGSARHVSVHAAGIVISPETLTDFVPLQKEPSGDKIITQYEMHSCDDIGLVKLDILGIRNLSILRGAVELANKSSHKKIDVMAIPLNDKKTFEMLSRGETMGIFQLSGAGMTRYVTELQPERVEDLMAMVALFRPGPMAVIPEYIARKKGKQKLKYFHPKMRKFLDKSFGLLVYQDDLLFTAMELAGYDWEEVDKFRKAVGKKIPEEMARQHEKFVKGCMEHSKMTRKQAEDLWRLFEPFQAYGFNKAHAASYGMLAYRTAYMKANFPVEFMTALLTAEANDKDKVSAAINECRRMDIKVLPPDINQSDVAFKIVADPESTQKKAIRFGLDAIKNVGKAAIEAILEARQKAEFASLADFLSRTDSRRVNKKVLESLIKVGALSTFGSRAVLLSSYEEIRDRVAKPKGPEGQQGLFAQEEMANIKGVETTLLNTDLGEFSEEELKSFERQLLGFSLSAKPVGEVIKGLTGHATHKIREIGIETQIQEKIKIAGVISEIRVVITRRTGKEMAFVKVEDDTGIINVVVFPQLFESSRNLWVDSKPILVTGKIDQREDETSVLADKIETSESLAQKSNLVEIMIPKKASAEKLRKLKELFLDHPGDQEVVLDFEKSREKIKLQFKIAWTKSLGQRVAKLLGTKN